MDPATVGQTDSILRCKACRAPVNSHKIIPPSPTPHLHRTIQMPNASEASILQKALRHANSDLHELHGDIAHIQAILDKLRLKRKSLRKFTIEHDAFLAPIRRLPAEILIEIFMLCMNYNMSSFSPNCSPSLFGQVCRGWRQVALSTQKLWSSVTVTHYRPSSTKAKLWISRASSVPLTICLASVHPESGRVGKIQPVIAVLVQHCDRWRHLDLYLDDSMLPCLSSIKHHLPWLESIRIERPTRPRELDVFEVAPRLRSFCSGPHVYFTGLKLPWHQLTDLNAHIHTITECLNILQLVPNLVKCTLYNQSSLSEASTPPQNIPILTFPHLRFFSILRIHPDEIFKHLQLPVIHTLHVLYQDKWKRKRSKDLKWFARQPFMSLLSCSSHTLRKLVIDHLVEFEDSVHIAHCLRATPLLEALCLRGPGFWVTADFLRLLTRQGNIKELVPNLEDLEIHDRYISCDHSTSMIESRWRVGEDDNDAGARLKRLRFEMSAYTDKWLVDAEILNRLRKCRQEGMVISIFALGMSKRDLLDIP
ncbi:hypothetical protein PILCRDRAFT_12204 [Piloderma croceum F 1598]|uniref:Uncharacterized protein n=1 Tax=Piloderma croceum (strain F 1598) TaxID=765440 RepID=A0A0C3FBV3_PILCF|nr:hypothetical protein PILCRDRAFT_12204 [Piloderma croceum F 1598]